VDRSTRLIIVLALLTLCAPSLLIGPAAATTRAAVRPTDKPQPTVTAQSSVTPQPTATPAYHPTLLLSQTHGMTGSTILLDATGYKTGQTIVFYWDRIDPAQEFGRGIADLTGAARLDLVLGQFAATVGDHRIFAAANTPINRASAFFHVDPYVAPQAACGGFSGGGVLGIPSFCLDPLGDLSRALRQGMSASARAIGGQVASSLTRQPDYGQGANGQPSRLSAPFAVAQGLARDLFGLLFLAGILATFARRLGVMQPGEAGGLLVQGALGSAATAALPTLLHLWIGGVNEAASALLADPTTQGDAIVSDLVGMLLGHGGLAGIVALPLVLTIMTVLLFAFLIVLVLTIISRVLLVMIGGVLYVLSALAIVCSATPLTHGVAKAWCRLWFSVTLSGVAYAAALVAVRALIATFTDEGLFQGGLQPACEAFAGMLVIYQAPRIADALIGGGAMRVLGVGGVPGLRTAFTMGAATLGGATVMAASGAGSASAAGAGAIPSDPSVSGGGRDGWWSMTEEGAPALGAGQGQINRGVLDAEWGLLESAGV